MKLWDAASGQEVLTFTENMDHVDNVNCMVFSPDGKRLVTAASQSGFDKEKFRPLPGEVKVWDVVSGKELLTLKKGEGQYAAASTTVAFSPDGKRLASVWSDDTVKVWDAVSGQEICTFKGHTSLSFSPDGKSLASASEDKTVKLWDVATGKEILTLRGHTAGVASVSISPDGQRLASASPKDNTVKLWDLNRGQEVLTLKVPGVRSVVFSPDGKRLVSTSPKNGWDDEIRIWDASQSVTDSAQGCNTLAWLLATHTEPHLRNPTRAVELAKKAVELAPNQGTYWNTLGAAHYRAGNRKEAIAALHKSMELRKGGDSHDWFFLAMAHWQLGQKDDARKWYDQAVAGMEKQRASQQEELKRFRAEAAQLLGITKKEP